jgi:Flp pilus assembly pilin Flp
LRPLINHFAKDEQGAALLEYGLLVGLIAVVSLTAVQVFGQTVFTWFATTDADLAGI